MKKGGGGGLVARTLDRLLLRNVALASALVLLVNMVTRNPDTLSSVFVSYLCISPLTRAGFTMSNNLFLSNLIGTVIGTLVTGVVYVEPGADEQLLWIKVPLAVSITLYALLVVRRYSPGDISGGLFSALFIQVKTFEYEPIEDYIEDLPLPIVTPQRHTKWQRHEVVSTLVVRIIALSTSVVCASLVNFLVSGGAIDRIFKARLYFTEKMIQKAFSSISVVPTSFIAQESFRQTVALIEREWTATQKTKDLLGTIQHRAEAVFRLLNLQVTLCLLSREPGVTHEEEEALSTLLRYSHACNLIGDHLTPQHSGCLTDGLAIEGLKELADSKTVPPTVVLFARMLHLTLVELERTSVDYRRSPHPLWWDCILCRCLPADVP
ncbi:uncharacterized protein ACA1_201610 [Acanthamoeba castellanii str. Neff]|uniref:Uncharacterized protein n=1 Tax=Acanthamoeba castellanii (strain ATCC 30010 / Neff) TaxID=1257118 RepID=L8H4Y4_ACACF|nr:uncharacterized protein ACA1_201610 [Acanthamoeba castellanii str. Neff]ELR19793.1 hypothetical protein ACA1_201610 [Acanthamoeba castellanii str. Neff]